MTLVKPVIQFMKRLNQHYVTLNVDNLKLMGYSKSYKNYDMKMNNYKQVEIMECLEEEISVTRDRLKQIVVLYEHERQGHQEERQRREEERQGHQEERQARDRERQAWKDERETEKLLEQVINKKTRDDSCSWCSFQ